ncbi:MAG TPA: hypothetical protein VHZ49_21565 [Methylomirabilota bacterium]|jgi:hypothetical protein|nr:hypothetical protein [Methylomirabilota bacterium]
MRILTSALTAAVVLMHGLAATAQPLRQPAATRGGSPAGGNSNTNTLSTGSNTSTNANSNSQFLSGSNTGVNNGALDVYAGSDPYQGIVLEGSVNLPQLPGVPSAPSNFSQPYKPDTFINTPVFLPREMTLSEAKACRSAKSSWYGGARDDEAPAIKLFYARKPESGPDAITMASYVGTAMVTTSDGPFIAALCEAAYRAMRKGATAGMVEFSIRPKNTMFGIGFGASGGATGLPAAGAHPYAIAGTLGFGTGWSNQRVEGEVVLQLTAVREPEATSTSESGAPAAASGSSSSLPASEPLPASEAPAPRGEATVLEPSASSAAGVQVLLTASRAARPPRVATYHSPKALTKLQKGQSKEFVFELFGTAFVEQDGKVVEVQGIRLRGSRKSKTDTRVEIGEVSLADGNDDAAPYWFLFEDNRLVAWRRAEQSSAAANSAELRPPQVEARVSSGRGR